MNRILSLVLCAVLCFSAWTSWAQIGNFDEYGWSVIKPSSDSRIVYVSSSEGSDSNDGLSESSPLKTLGAANNLIRDGYPDHLLLKRGDLWDFTTFGRWKNGRSKDEPLVLSYYGSTGARPVIKVNTNFINFNGKERNHVAIIGIDFYRAISDPHSEDFDPDDLEASSSGTILRFVGPAANILVEDCLFRFGFLNVQGWPTAGVHWVDNFQFRRNIVTDTWADSTTYNRSPRPQGLYITGAKNILIEENVFDHNGWNEEIATAGANQLCHNIYMHNGNDEDVIIRGNIFSRAGSHGIQMRSGAVCEMNFFVRNSVAASMGYSSQEFRINGDDSFVDNVSLEGRTQMPYDSGPQTGALWGMTLGQSHSNTFYADDNIIAHLYQTEGATNINAYPDWEPNDYGSGNIGWDWGDKITAEEGTDWSDPDRTTADYQAFIGRTPSFDAYIATARSRELHTMPWDYTAYAIVDFIREGFDKNQVTPPYLYDMDHLPCQAVTSVSIDTSDFALNRGKVLQLNVTLAPEGDLCDETVLWSSSNSEIVTVDEDGLITALSAGTAEITAVTVDGGFADAITVKVNNTPLGTGSGAETFTMLGAPKLKTSTGTYVGDNGEIWAFSAVQKVDGITDSTAMLRKLNGKVKTILPDGLIDLSFTISSSAEYGGIPTIALYINDELYGSFSPDNVDEAKTISLTDINAFGPVKLHFYSITAYTWLDDISWTDNSGKVVLSADNSAVTDPLLIYPNPVGVSTDFIHYEMPNADRVNIAIMSLEGKVVRSVEGVASSGELSVTGVEKGIYVMRLTSSDQVLVRKVVVE